MKKSLLTLLSVWALALILLPACSSSSDDEEMKEMEEEMMVQGCTNEKSDNYDPDATEDDGSCVLWRDKVLGTFVYTRECGPAFPAKTDDLIITTIMNTDDSIHVEYGFILDYDGVMTSSTEFIIPETPGATQGETISATGSIENDVITLTYISKNQATQLECSGTAPRK